jgi:FecR protein
VSQTHDEIRALRVMVDELRAEPAPELAWDAIEQRLLSQIGVRPLADGLPSEDGPRLQPVPLRFASARPPRASSPLMRVFGFAAAAAVLALGVGSVTSGSELPSAATPARHVIESTAVAFASGNAPGSTARDLSTLRPGDVVEAGEAPVSFGQAGLAQWTLAPGSALRVRSVGVGHTVALERGSLRAEVTPRDASEGLVEAFAVEVGGTRVAVHGTAFSVTIEGNRAVVDVEHGAVAIGPVGYAGATTGHLLVGPARASFSLDGGRSARLLERVSQPALVADAAKPPALSAEQPAASVDEVREPPTVVARAIDIVAAAPRAGVSARAPSVAVGGSASPVVAPEVRDVAVPAAAVPSLSAATIQARVARCFKRDPAADPTAVRVSVSSTLHIGLKADGTVKEMGLSPPLKTDVSNCIGGAVAGRYGGDLRDIFVPITFQP